MSALSDHIRTMTPRTKAFALLGGVVVCALLIAQLLSDNSKHPQTRAKDPEVNVVSPVRVTGLEGYTAELKELRQKQEDLAKALEQYKGDRTKRGGAGGDFANDFAARVLAPGGQGDDDFSTLPAGSGGGTQLPTLRNPGAVNEPAPHLEPPPQQIPTDKTGVGQPDTGKPPPLTPQTNVFQGTTRQAPPLPPAAGTAGAAQSQQPMAPGAAPAVAPAPAAPPRTGIRVMNADGVVGEGEAAQLFGARSASTAAKTPAEAFIPAGSMFSGIFLNGLDAPTSGAAKQSPTPIVLRVKREALLPNYASIDVQECFLLASGYGELATERVKMRAETLACVRTDGKVLETPLDAYLVGADGKVGIPGRLVSKQGQMIAKSLIAGTLGGLGQALNRTRVPALNINPSTGQGIYQSDSVSSIFQAGIAGGLETTTTMIAKFYLDMAKEMFPVVEVPAGVTATVVVTTGSKLPLRGSQPLELYASDTTGSTSRASAQHSPSRTSSTPRAAKAEAATKPGVSSAPLPQAPVATVPTPAGAAPAQPIRPAMPGPGASGVLFK